MIGDIVGLFILILLLAFVFFVGHGYANTVDSVAMFLHRHAMDTRRRHQRQTAKVQEGWVKQMEADGQPNPADVIKGLVIRSGGEVNTASFEQARAICDEIVIHRTVGAR